MPKLGLGSSLSRASLVTPGIVTDSLVMKHNYSGGSVVPVSDGAAYFDGDADYIALGSAIQFADGANWSLSFWVNGADLEVASTVQYLTYDATGWISYYEPNRIVIYPAGGYDAAVNFASISPGFKNNTWYYITFTCDGDSIYLYRDGILIDSGDPSVTTFEIGAFSDPAGSYEFEGYICNAGVWSGTLTPAQIKSIMNKNYAGLTSSEKDNLVSWWNLDVGYDENKHNNVQYGTVFDNHHAGGSSSFGTELISNGDFSDGTTGWTLEDETSASMSVVGDGLKLEMTDDASTYAHISTAIPGAFVVGTTYKIEMDISKADNAVDTGFYFVRIGTSSSADEHGSGLTHIVYGNGKTGSADPKDQSVGDKGAGTHTFYYKATHSHAYLVIGARNDIINLTIDNVSLKEVLGNTGQTL